MSTKDNLRQYLADDPDFNEYDAEAQERIINNIASSKESLDSFIMNEPDFQSLDEEAKSRVLANFAPEFYGATPQAQAPDLLTDVLASRTTPAAKEPLAPVAFGTPGGWDVQSMMAGAEAMKIPEEPAAPVEPTAPRPPRSGLDWQASRGGAAQEVMEPWDKPISNVTKRVAASAADAVSGAMQLMRDANTPVKDKRYQMYYGNQPEPMLETIDRGVAYLRNKSKEFLQETEEYRNALNLGELAAYDLAVDLIDSAPAVIAGFISGSWIPATIIGGTQALVTKYGQMREAGHGMDVSLGRSVVPAVTSGALAGFTVGNALGVGRTATKRMARAAGVDFFGSLASQNVEYVSDWAVDEFFRENQGKIGDQRPYEEVMKDMLWRSFINMGSGQVFTGMPELINQAKLKANGLAEVTDSLGRQFVMPEHMRDGVEQFVDAMPKDMLRDIDPQTLVQDIVRVQASAEMYEAQLAQIRETQNAQPDLSPQERAPRYRGKFETGTEIAVDARAFKTDRPISTEVNAKVVKTEVRSPEGGGKPEIFVTVQLDDSGETITVRQNALVQRKAPVTGANGNLESPHLVLQFLKDFLDPTFTTPTNQLNYDQARLAFGGFFKIAEKLRRGALAGASEKKGYMAAVWDAMDKDPQNLARILAHEPGHLIWNLDPAAMKELGLEGFQPFKDFATERAKAADLSEDMKTQYLKWVKENPDATDSIGEWFIRTKYGEELQDMWDAWALFKSKASKFNPETRRWEGGSVDELMANAISLLINDAAGMEKPDLVWGGNKSFNLQDTQLYKDFYEYAAQNPSLQQAIDRLRQRRNNPDSILYTVVRGMTDSDTAQSIFRQKKQEAGEMGMVDMLRTLFENEFHPIMKAAEYSPVARELMDGMLLGNAKETKYLESALQPIIKTLKAEGIDLADYNAYALARRVKYDRQKDILALKPGETVESFKDLKVQMRLFGEKIFEAIQNENPSMAPEKVRALADDQVKAMQNDATFKLRVQELLNPYGLTKKTADQLLAELQAKYPNKDVLKIFGDLHDNAHKAMTDWILPTLKDSQMFTPDILKHMETNDDYVTFSVVYQELLGNPRRRKDPGSIQDFHEQTGTLGNVVSPLSATAERMVKMAISARRASTMRDMLANIAKLQADAGDLNPAVQRVVKDENGQYPSVQAGHELVVSRRYNPKDGLVPEAYIVRSDLLTGFKQGSNLVTKAFDFLSGPHNYLKSWMTVFNPGFWLTNWMRDVIRTAINAPGYAAILEIPKEAAKAAIEDYKKGGRSIERDEMTRMNLLQDAGDYVGVRAADSEFDKLLIRAGQDPKTLNGIWDNMNMLSRAYYTINHGYKRFALGIGGSLEYSTKASMKRYLDKYYPDMPREMKNDYIRNFAGTPLLARKSAANAVLSNVFLFYNPNIQGLSSDIRASNKLDTWVKRAGALFMYQAAASLVMGQMGKMSDWLIPEDWKEMVRRVNVGDWGRGVVIPFGLTSEGDAIWATLPLDPTSKFINVLMRATMDKMLDGTYSFGDLGSAFTGNAEEALPSLSPLLKAPLDLMELMQTGNITGYRGMKAIPEEIQKSDQEAEKVKFVAMHFLRSGFGGPLNQVTRFPIRSPRPKEKGKYGQERFGQTFIDTLNDMIGVPLFSPQLGRFIRVGSQGIQQRQLREKTPIIEAKQTERNLATIALNDYIYNGKPMTEQMAILVAEKYGKKLEQLGLRSGIMKQLAQSGRPDLQPYMDAVLKDLSSGNDELLAISVRELLRVKDIKR